MTNTIKNGLTKEDLEKRLTKLNEKHNELEVAIARGKETNSTGMVQVWQRKQAEIRNQINKVKADIKQLSKTDNATE